MQGPPQRQTSLQSFPAFQLHAPFPLAGRHPCPPQAISAHTLRNFIQQFSA
jgi:hypothetical protein